MSGYYTNNEIAPLLKLGSEINEKVTIRGSIHPNIPIIYVNEIELFNGIKLTKDTVFDEKLLKGLNDYIENGAWGRIVY